MNKQMITRYNKFNIIPANTRMMACTPVLGEDSRVVSLEEHEIVAWRVETLADKNGYDEAALTSTAWPVIACEGINLDDCKFFIKTENGIYYNFDAINMNRDEAIDYLNK